MPPRGRAPPPPVRLNDLPADVLSLILSMVPFQQRLGLATVCSAFTHALAPPSAAWSSVDLPASAVCALAQLASQREAAAADPATVAWATRLLTAVPLLQDVTMRVSFRADVVAGARILARLLGGPPPPLRVADAVDVAAAQPALAPALRHVHLCASTSLYFVVDSSLLSILFRGSASLTSIHLSLMMNPSYISAAEWGAAMDALGNVPVSPALRSLRIGGPGTSRNMDARTLSVVGAVAWRAPGLRELEVCDFAEVVLPAALREVALTRLALSSMRYMHWDGPDRFTGAAITQSLAELSVAYSWGLSDRLGAMVESCRRLTSVEILCDLVVSSVARIRTPRAVQRKDSLRSLTIKILPGLRADAHAATVFHAGVLSRPGRSLTSLVMNNTSIRRFDVRATAFPDLRVLDLRAQRLSALPVLKGSAPRLEVLSLGWPDWGEAPVTVRERVADSERGRELGAEWRGAAVRHEIDVSDWSMPRRAFPASLARIEIHNVVFTADGAITRLSKGKPFDWPTPAALARALAGVMSATTVSGLRVLKLVNVSTSTGMIRDMMADDGAVLRAAYTPRGSDASRLRVVGECLFVPPRPPAAAAVMAPPQRRPPLPQPLAAGEGEQAAPRVPGACLMQ